MFAGRDDNKKITLTVKTYNLFLYKGSPSWKKKGWILVVWGSHRDVFAHFVNENTYIHFVQFYRILCL